MVPMQSMIIPEFVNLAGLGFINHYYAAILVYAALGTPFATFLMTTYFRRLPEDVIEASLIDGLGYGKIFARVMLPLAVPAIVTVAVLQFIQIWDDLLVGLLFLQSPRAASDHGRARDDPLPALPGRARAHGGLARERASGCGRLPRLPALPDPRPDDGHEQVDRLSPRRQAPAGHAVPVSRRRCRPRSAGGRRPLRDGRS